MRKFWHKPATIVQYVRRTMGKQHDIPADQLPTLSRFGVFKNGPAFKNNMVGNFMCGGLLPSDTPWCAVDAANLQLPLESDQLQKLTQPIDLVHVKPALWVWVNCVR